MFTVTLFIQATISVSTCCEVSSNARTLNLRSHHTQHSTLVLSKINLTAGHNGYRRNTQPVPDRTHKASAPATASLYILLCACYILLT